MSSQVLQYGDPGSAPEWPPDMAGVVHDLRSPLGVIAGYASLLLGGDLGALPEPAGQAVEGIAAKVAELQVLVEGLLDVSRPDADGVAARLTQSLDLRDVAREAVLRAAPRAGFGGDALELSLDGPIPVRCNPRLVARALDNLINNALTHGRHPGRISVTASRRGGYGEVRVQDDGDGLQPAVLDRLYLPAARTDPEGGTPASSGLGLYITRTLVDLCGGDLRHERPAEGGAAFVIELPLAF